MWFHRIKTLLFFFIICALFFPRVVAAAEIPSANIPLDSYVYGYLEKLDGLGYMQAMRTGTKPYTRMQVANWVRQISAEMEAKKDAPEYAKAMLSRLQNEFQQELTLDEEQDGLTLRSFSLEEFYQNKDTYQPLNVYNYGNKYSSSTNETLSLDMENKINDSFLLQLSPRIGFSDHKTTINLTSGYLKTSLDDAVLEVGKDSIWWGQGSRGGLLMTNNATPLNVAKITWADTTLFYSILETNRSDVKYPSFVGIRKDFSVRDFTFGLAMTSILGGEGHMLNRSDYNSWLSGRNAYTNDKWDDIAGGDFRWRLPGLNGLQFYGEIYGEDQSHICKYIPVPSELGELAGFYLPRLSADGSWDAKLEWSHTRPCWYKHGVYTQGYTYYGNIMGDAMGANAYRYNLNLTHYNPNESQFSLNLEQVSRNFTSSIPETTDSLWITTRNPCGKNLYLQTEAGVARTKNSGHIAGDHVNNFFAGLSLTAQW